MDWLAAFFCVITVVQASHFRGGIISISPVSSANKTVEVTFRMSYRRNHVYAAKCNEAVVEEEKEVGSHPDNQGIRCVAGCPISNQLVSKMRYVCTDFSTTDNWEYGEKTFRFSFPNSTIIRLSTQGCCWIHPFGSGDWDVFTAMKLSVRPDINRINSSPQARFFPVVPIQEGCNSTIMIRPYDPDDDVVRCRWANTSECGGICNGFRGAVLDEQLCTLSYWSQGKDSGFKAVALVMEDFSPTDRNFERPFSTVALNFLVRVSKSNLNCTASLPQFVEPTPLDRSCFAIRPNERYNGQIVIDTHVPTASVTEIKTVGPVGLDRSALTTIQGTTTTYMNISWFPDTSDYFENNNRVESMCFTAVISSGQSSEERCIQWMAGVIPPQVVLSSAMPKNNLVHPVNPSFEVMFDQSINKPFHKRKFVIKDILRNKVVYTLTIGSEKGRESVQILNSNKLRISTNFRFEEKRMFSVNFEQGFVKGITGCGAESEPFPQSEDWQFETKDITPPRITFIANPRRSNGTISIKWNVNEPVSISSCILSIEGDTSLTQLNCSQDRWVGQGLKQGKYTINVTKTDLAGNTATRLHSWVVDQIAPNITFKPPFSGNASNHKSVRIRLECPQKPYCIYNCIFGNNARSFKQVDCSNGWFTQSGIPVEGEYHLIVNATDDVGNSGKNHTLTWIYDFTPPVIGPVSNEVGKCDSDLSPANLSMPSVTDNFDPNPKLSYIDEGSRGICQINRVWTVTDAAGNTANTIQTITLVFEPVINLLPQLRLPCDPAQSLEVPAQTANTDNICSREIELTYTDSASLLTCPTQITRTWSAKDSCDQTKPSSSKTQVLTFYSICPPSACGRSNIPPHGTCIEGNCLCNKPWSGEDCDIIIYEPIIRPITRRVMLKERELYEENLQLLQGTEPVYWEVKQAPDGLSINQRTGMINWQANIVGNHSVQVTATNSVGIGRISLNITVSPGYRTELDPLPQEIFSSSKQVKLIGRVVYEQENLVASTSNGQVPVDVIIFFSGTTRKYQTTSKTDGSFSVSFEPLRTEYGQYEAVSSHPGVVIPMPIVEWRVLGMRFTKPVVTINEETLTNVNRLFSNYTELLNDGPQDLTDIKVVSVLNVLDDVQVEFLFGQDKTVPLLRSGTKVPFNIRIIAAQAFGKMRVFCTIRSAEDVITRLILDAEISLSKPSFSFSPGKVDDAVVRGSQKIVQVNITNTGRAEATEVYADVPRVKYLSVVQFGNSSYADNRQNIQVGQSLLLVLQLSAESNSDLGRYSGRIGIAAKQLQESIPLNLRIISNERSTVTFRVEDEFTYFADGAPLVENARIRISNNLRGITMTKTTMAGKGMVTFTDVPEGTYEVYAEAPRHTGVKGVHTFKPGVSTIRIFLQRAAVTYRWTVTPTEVEDVYRIKVEADFETRVPMPVVTVTPTSIELEPFELGWRDSFELNVTNHGLIRADQFSFNFPKSHPSLEFIVIAKFESLEAKTSKVVPVKVNHKKGSRRKRSSCGGNAATVRYGYECGGWVAKSRQVSLVSPVHECTSFNPRGSGGGGGYIRLCCGHASGGKSFCDPCLQSWFNCLLGFTPLGPIPCVISGIQLAFTPNPKTSDYVDYAVCASKVALAIAFPPLGPAFALFDCIKTVIPACSGNQSPKGARKKRDVRNQLILNMAEALQPIQTLMEWKLEVFGKQVWLSVDDEYWMTAFFIPAVSDQSDQGEAITRPEFDVIMSKNQPVGLTKQDVADFLNRWNNTVFDWRNGRTEPTVNDSNRISFEKFKKIKIGLHNSNMAAQSAGFGSIMDQYNDRVQEINKVKDWDEGKGVCAVVRVRIEQELALTREGFIAKLEIDNGETSTLEKIDVKIRITDAENGAESTMLFSIGNATLGGAIKSDRSLDMMQNGELSWLMIPYSEAAPIDDRFYDVGGILYYEVNGATIKVPLLPARITVKPDPQLLVHYFWEKFVISDDPFTDNVEGAIPFSLAVAVKNAGNGTAKNLRITSSQPEIVENKKGLLVTFKMIGANIGNMKVTPSLKVNFGDINPGMTVVASWWMISSLQGQFQNYSATFENENPLGDPRLSLLDELEVHELLRQVRIVEGGADDQVQDFLVNEIIDYDIYPDAIYSSDSLQRYDVSVQNISLVKINDFGTFTDFILSSMPSVGGFVYYRFETATPVIEHVSIESTFFNRKVQTDETLPAENAWFTSKIGERDSNVLIGHMFDFITDVGSVHEYTISLNVTSATESLVTLKPTETPIDVTLAPLDASTTPGVIVGRITTPPTSGAKGLIATHAALLYLMIFTMYFQG